MPINQPTRAANTGDNPSRGRACCAAPRTGRIRGEPPPAIGSLGVGIVARREVSRLLPVFSPPRSM